MTGRCGRSPTALRLAGGGLPLALPPGRLAGPALARAWAFPAGFGWHRTGLLRIRAACGPWRSRSGVANGRPGTHLNSAMCSLLDRPVHGTVTAGQNGRHRQCTILRQTSADCGRLRPSFRKTRPSGAGRSTQGRGCSLRRPQAPAGAHRAAAVPRGPPALSRELRCNPGPRGLSPAQAL
jgi:hypothetical protein